YTMLGPWRSTRALMSLTPGAVLVRRPVTATLPVASLTRTYASRKQGQAKKTKRHLGPPPNTVDLATAVSVLKAYEVGRPNCSLQLHVQCFYEKHLPPVRGSCLLPKSVQDEVRVLVFAQGTQAKEAEEAGAYIVGGAELLSDIVEGKLTFDKCLSSVEMMPTVAKIARYLGPKGLMPTKNRGTVTNDLAAAVKYARSTFDYQMDKHGVVHCVVARAGFTQDEVRTNIDILMQSIRRQTPANKKGTSKSQQITRTVMLTTPRLRNDTADREGGMMGA
ncbi:hypothetical protein H4R34_001594, partial [Dimargaris verticillata]